MVILEPRVPHGPWLLTRSATPEAATPSGLGRRHGKHHIASDLLAHGLHIGALDDDGYLTITDRTADLIIRGGENISATEVEEVLLALPGVAEAAVVAAPDARLGEHAAAVLRLAPGHPVPALEQLRAHFERSGLARQKWPEELHAVGDFPRTASGKVQKFVLRADIAARQNRE